MAEPWKNAYGTLAFPTLEEWLREEAKNGQKLTSVMFATDTHLRGEILWTNGTAEEIIVGPRAPGQVCVLARREVAGEPAAG